MKTLGDIISTQRKVFNLTQAELAEKLFVSPQAVSKWELGKAEPDLKTIVMLSEIFNLDYQEFLKAIPNESKELKTCEMCLKQYPIDELKQIDHMHVCKSCQVKLKEERARMDHFKDTVHTKTPYVRILKQAILAFIIIQVFFQIIYFIPSDVEVSYISYTLNYLYFGLILITHITLLRIPSGYRRHQKSIKQLFKNVYTFVSDFLPLISLVFWLPLLVLSITVRLILALVNPIYIPFTFIKHLKEKHV